MLAIVLFYKFSKTQNGAVTPTIHSKTASNNQSHQNVIPLSAHLVFTKHAKCRMNCRHIDEGEIREIIRDGVVNYQKSIISDTPCVTIAIEGTQHDNQQLRIVFAKCDNEVKVVTCIDLKNDYEYDCK